MPKFVYVDASNNVIAESKVARTLPEVQVKNPSITGVISDAPDDVVYQRDFRSGKTYFHQLNTGEDGTDISHYTEVTFLDVYKELKINLIERKTRSILAQGTDYLGKTFSLATEEVTDYQTIYMLMQAGEIPVGAYPIRVVCLDGYSIASFADQAEFEAFFIAIAKARYQIKKGDVQLKRQVVQAASKQEVDDVTDDR